MNNPLQTNAEAIPPLVRGKVEKYLELLSVTDETIINVKFKTSILLAIANVLDNEPDTKGINIVTGLLTNFVEYINYMKEKHKK